MHRRRWLQAGFAFLFLSVSALPAAAEAPPLFSVAATGDHANLYTLGAKTVRMYANWKEAQPTADSKLDLSSFDYYLHLYQSQGLTPVVVIAGVPDWACAVPPLPGDTAGMTCPPQEKPYTHFLQSLVATYRYKVRFWEVGNEPNTAVRNWTPAYYARHLVITYQAIKAMSNATVSFAGLTQDLTAGKFFDEERKEGDFGGQYMPALIYAKKVMDVLNSTDFLTNGRAYDAVAIHPYRTMTSPSGTVAIVMTDGSLANVTLKQQLQALQRVFYENDPQRRPPEVWITEIGWGAIDDKDDMTGGMGTVSLRKQRLYLTELYRLAMDDTSMQFVKMISWTMDQDTDVSREAQTGARGSLLRGLMGLRLPDGTLKPAGEAYWHLSQEWLQKNPPPQ